MDEFLLIQNMFSGSVLREKHEKMKKKRPFQKSGIFPMDSPISINFKLFVALPVDISILDSAWQNIPQ